MKTILILLVLGFATVHSSFGQTLKNLTYNASNGQVIANTGSNVLTFTNSVYIGGSIRMLDGTNKAFEFPNDAEAEFSYGISFLNTNAASGTRTNLGLGATWLTNTNVTNFRTAVGLGSTNFVIFNGLEAMGVGIEASGILLSGSNATLSFEEESAKAQTRTNLGLGASWLINTNNPVFVNTNGTLATPTNFFTANLPIWATSTNPASAASSLGQALSAPSYLRTSSRDTSSNNAGGIVSAISFDGINWEATRNHTIFPVFSRDASPIWYSNKWVSIYTDAFGSTNKTFGIATSTDLLSWQTNFSVTLTGTNTAGTGNNVWAPEWFVDGTNYYALVRLSTTAGNNYGAPGVGWMRALNPGTWTSWSDWTPFDSTVRIDANDFYIVKKDNLYWLFSHGGTHLNGKQPAGSNVVNNITLQYSTNPFGNYSPLVEITEPLRQIIRPGNSSAFFEGPSVVNVEGSRWRLFFQDGLDNTAWAIDSYDDFATWNTNSLRRLQYSGFDGSGHGTVVGINTSNQQGVRQAVLALGTGPTIGGAWLTNTNVTNFRTAIGLGSAATNDSAAFQPASANLTNLASNNAINLTNFPALLLRTNGSAAGLTSFPTLNQNTTGTASNVTGVVALTNGGTGTNSAGGARTNLELGITNSVVFSNITANGTLGVSNAATFATNVTIVGNLTAKSLVTSDPVNIILDATQTSAATNGVLTLPDNANLIRLTNNNAISAVTNGRLGSFYYLVNQATNAVTLSNVGGITVDGATNLTLAPNESATLVALGPTNISVANRGGLETNNNVTFSNITASGTITATGTLTATGNVTMNGSGNLAPSQAASSGASLMTRDLIYQSEADFNSGDPIGIVAATAVGSGAGQGQYITLGWQTTVTTNANTAAGAYFGDATWSQSSFSGAAMPANKAVDLTMKGVMLRVESNTNFVNRVAFGVGAATRTPPAAGNPAATNQSWGVNFFYDGTNQVYQPFWYTTNYNTAPTAVVPNLSTASWLGRVYTMRFQQTTNGQISFYINDGFASRLSSTPTWTTNVTWPSTSYGGRFIGMECATATNAAPATGVRIHFRVAYLRYDP